MIKEGRWVSGIQWSIVGIIVFLGILAYRLGSFPERKEAPSFVENTYAPITVVDAPVVGTLPNVVGSNEKTVGKTPKVEPFTGDRVVYLTAGKDFAGKEEQLLLLDNRFHPERKGQIPASFTDYRGKEIMGNILVDWGLADVEKSEKIPIVTSPFQYGLINDSLFSDNTENLFFSIIQYSGYPYIRCFKDDELTKEIASCRTQEYASSKHLIFPSYMVFPEGYIVYKYNTKTGNTDKLFGSEDVQKIVSPQLRIVNLKDVSPKERYLRFSATSWCFACDTFGYEDVVFDTTTKQMIKNLGRTVAFEWLEHEKGFMYKVNQWTECNDPDALGTGDITSCWKNPDVLPWEEFYFN